MSLILRYTTATAIQSPLIKPDSEVQINYSYPVSMYIKELAVALKRSRYRNLHRVVCVDAQFCATATRLYGLVSVTSAVECPWQELGQDWLEQSNPNGRCNLTSLAKPGYGDHMAEKLGIACGKTVADMYIC